MYPTRLRRFVHLCYLSYKLPEKNLARRSFAVFAIALLAAANARAQTVVEMQTGIPGAKFVPIYSMDARAAALQRAMHLAALPILGAPISLTPNAPYAPDGAHLSFWKPSYVIGTPDGGEAGINFWGKFQEGHMNVALADARPTLLDCRILSTGNITYKIYDGGTLDRQGEAPLRDGHFLLAVSSSTQEQVSVELWPAVNRQPVGIFGCELSAIEKGLP